MIKSFIPLLLAALLISSSGESQVFYISPVNGSDNNKGTITEPFATLEKAVTTANDLTGDGQITIKLFPGLYLLKNKIVINPARVINDTTRYTLEAVTMPDDEGWTPYDAPVIQSISTNNSNTQFPHATGILVASNHVTIRGVRFIGNPKNTVGRPNGEASYYYPISREDERLRDLEVSQCFFIAEKNSTPIQGGIWAHGPDIQIDHCIFFNCRNAILLFRSVQRFSIADCIIYGAYESAIWMGAIDSGFIFKNNVVSGCDYFWVRPENTIPNYKFSNCLITENNHYTGYYTNSGLKETSNNRKFTENNVIKTGRINLIEMSEGQLPNDFLNLKPGSPGYDLGAGIFKKKRNK